MTKTKLSRRSPKIFITYSRKDEQFAHHLADSLRKYDLESFLDSYSIAPGENLTERIEEALATCDVYIPILSFAALKSPWCTEEINAAISLSNDSERRGRPSIIPVLTEECQSEMPVLLRSRSCIDFTNRFEEALGELTEKGFGLRKETSESAGDMLIRFFRYVQINRRSSGHRLVIAQPRNSSAIQRRFQGSRASLQGEYCY